MPRPSERPTGGRIALAFLAAPGVPILLVAAVFAALTLAEGGSFGEAWRTVALVLVGGVFLGYGPALFVGLPAYLVLRGQIRVTAASAGLVGVVLASALPLGSVLMHPPEAAAGPLDNAASVALLAGLGLVGGLVFWLVHEQPWRRRRPHPIGDSGAPRIR